jgi:UTP-glucose-1-phosphate uridylyltransferase
LRQAEQLGLGHAVLCAERAVGGEPFAVLLADAIDIHARRGAVEAVTLSGRRFDCGSQEGFVAATIHEYARRGGTIDLGDAVRG